MVMLLPMRRLRRLTTPVTLVKLIICVGIVSVVIGFLMVELKLQPSRLVFRMLSCEKIELPPGGGCVNWEAQDTVDYIATHLDVRYKVLDNLNWEGKEMHKYYHASLTLRNTGLRPINTAVAWRIYFYNVHYATVVTPLEAPLARVNVSHVNSDLHLLEPTALFGVIGAGRSLTVTLRASHWMIARTDAMPNWYAVADGANPRVVTATAGQELAFVDAFDAEQRWKRRPWDVYAPFTAAQRYERNAAYGAPAPAPPVVVVPTPLTVGAVSGRLHLTPAKWTIVASRGLTAEAKLLAEVTGFPTSTKCGSLKCITLAVGQLPIPSRLLARAAEGYSIRMLPSGSIKIIGGGAAGVFYAVQTFLWLMDHRAKTVPIVNIIDVPRFQYRGLMLDVSRNFLPKKDVLDLLDLMALYKLNKFHLHLTDDPGWRIQIAGIPELTEVGGRRGHDPSERWSLLPSLGSGPYYNTSGSGYYTVADYREILRYATKLHIEVIPEVDVPGHSYAALKAMATRYWRHTVAGRRDEERVFQLDEAEDHSVYKSIQMMNQNVLNPCIESTYSFIAVILQSFVDMHKDIAPLRVFHFGGDEVPKGAHDLSPACRRHHPMSVREIYKRVFVKRVGKMAARLNVSLQGWGDAFCVGDLNLTRRADVTPGDIYVNTWQSAGQVLARAHAFANAGYKVILSLATHLYFDHPQEPDPEDRGLYWATRFIDTARVFGYRPDDFYENLDVDKFGRPMTKEDVCHNAKDPIDCVILKERKNIIGIQGHVWTETIRTRAQLDWMLFPRLLAMAERAWHKDAWEDMPTRTDAETAAANRTRGAAWQRFAQHLGTHELARLGRLGVKYYLPPPGVKMVDGQVKVNVAFPGLPIQFSTDSGATWTDWRDGTKVDKSTLFATRSFDGQRRSLSVRVAM